MVQVSNIDAIYTRHASTLNTWTWRFDNADHDAMPHSPANFGFVGTARTPPFVTAALELSYRAAEADAATRGGCVASTEQLMPPETRTFPKMPAECCLQAGDDSCHPRRGLYVQRYETIAYCRRHLSAFTSEHGRKLCGGGRYPADLASYYGGGGGGGHGHRPHGHVPYTHRHHPHHSGVCFLSPPAGK